MDYSRGASSGSGPHISGSESDLQQQQMDQRKRKRMISNRESARRSRLRKQKHIDGLTAQLAQLSQENLETRTGLNFTTQHYLNVEAENSILRAQAAELSQRLHSLNKIVSYTCAGAGGSFFAAEELANYVDESAGSGNCFSVHRSQPIIMAAVSSAAGGGFQYY